MADEKKGGPNLTGKQDPTIKTSGGETYPEGTHPLHPLAEQDWAAVNVKHEDNPDKPDPSTVAQIEVVPEFKER